MRSLTNPISLSFATTFLTHHSHTLYFNLNPLDMQYLAFTTTVLSFFALCQLFPLRCLLACALTGPLRFVAVSLALASPLPVQATHELNARQIPPPDYKILQRETLAFPEYARGVCAPSLSCMNI